MKTITLRPIFVGFMFILINVFSVFAHEDKITETLESDGMTADYSYQRLICGQQEENGTIPTLYYYKVIYVYDEIDEFETRKPLLEKVLIGADTILDRNAKDYNKSLHFNFPTNEDCSPQIEKMQSSYDFVQTNLEKTFQSKSSHKLKYLLFLEDMKGIAADDCGIFIGLMHVADGVSLDDTGGAAFVYPSCWKNGSVKVTTHELMHSLGAVQFNAPNTDYTYHLKNSIKDVMSYGVGSDCPNNNSFLFSVGLLIDCWQRNYLVFSDKPTPFYNIYNSRYLNHLENYYLFIPNITN